MSSKTELTEQQKKADLKKLEELTLQILSKLGETIPVANPSTCAICKDQSKTPKKEGES